MLVTIEIPEETACVRCHTGGAIQVRQLVRLAPGQTADREAVDSTGQKWRVFTEQVEGWLSWPLGAPVPQGLICPKCAEALSDVLADFTAPPEPAPEPTPFRRLPAPPPVVVPPRMMAPPPESSATPVSTPARIVGIERPVQTVQAPLPVAARQGSSIPLPAARPAQVSAAPTAQLVRPSTVVSIPVPAKPAPVMASPPSPVIRPATTSGPVVPAKPVTAGATVMVQHQPKENPVAPVPVPAERAPAIAVVNALPREAEPIKTSQTPEPPPGSGPFLTGR